MDEFPKLVLGMEPRPQMLDVLISNVNYIEQMQQDIREHEWNKSMLQENFLKYKKYSIIFRYTEISIDKSSHSSTELEQDRYIITEQ